MISPVSAVGPSARAPCPLDPGSSATRYSGPGVTEDVGTRPRAGGRIDQASAPPASMTPPSARTHSILVLLAIATRSSGCNPRRELAPRSGSSRRRLPSRTGPATYRHRRANRKQGHPAWRPPGRGIATRERVRASRWRRVSDLRMLAGIEGLHPCWTARSGEETSHSSSESRYCRIVRASRFADGLDDELVSRPHGWHVPVRRSMSSAWSPGLAS